MPSHSSMFDRRQTSIQLTPKQFWWMKSPTGKLCLMRLFRYFTLRIVRKSHKNASHCTDHHTCCRTFWSKKSVSLWNQVWLKKKKVALIELIKQSTVLCDFSSLRLSSREGSLCCTIIQIKVSGLKRVWPHSFVRSLFVLKLVLIDLIKAGRMPQSLCCF